MSNCTSINHINHVTIECSWTTVSLFEWCYETQRYEPRMEGKRRGRKMAVKQTRVNDLQTFGSWTTGHCQQLLIHSPLSTNVGVLHPEPLVKLSHGAPTNPCTIEMLVDMVCVPSFLPCVVHNTVFRLCNHGKQTTNCAHTNVFIISWLVRLSSVCPLVSLVQCCSAGWRDLCRPAHWCGLPNHWDVVVPVVCVCVCVCVLCVLSY